MGCLMLPHPLTNFEIQRYYQNEPKFDSVFWRNNLSLNNLTYGAIIANIFRVQAKDSAIHKYFCVGFIDFMLARKRLADYTSLFSPYDFKKNDDIILIYFKDEWQ